MKNVIDKQSIDGMRKEMQSRDTRGRFSGHKGTVLGTQGDGSLVSK